MAMTGTARRPPIVTAVGRSALLITDMITAYDFEDADAVAEHAPGPVQRIAELVASARQDGTLVVYVNDNYGNWNADRDDLLQHALEGAHPELVEPIQPEHELPFVWKPRHSAFYETSLNYLLRQHDVERLTLTGQVTEQCILYTALDAYIRHFEIVVPADAVVPIHPHLADAALEMMRVNMRAETPATGDLLASTA
jgi:nicotinamidase-related amidase